ncbi:MAG TPA: cysteine hydrolase family protein [Thermoanaerobaculaceae bacterium]|nr:cysteine hydrolase family protein [Thermoanaerobaculaceae bacterium]HPS79984.1 cysteine hydrolase family protein [Thermoanaerobaculaceae bacterium]
MTSHTLAILVLVLTGAAMATAQAPTQPAAPPDTALVIIDIQQFYFEGGRLPLVGPVEAAAKARQVLDWFRARSLPVVHVQHLGKDMPGPDLACPDPQYRIRPEVMPAAGEKLIGKHHISSFRDTDLEAWLRGRGITKLVLCGMQTHMCLEGAARAAADLGFEVTVIADACATRDLEYGGVKAPAAQVHASTLATLEGNYARVTTAAEWLAGPKR